MISTEKVEIAITNIEQEILLLKSLIADSEREMSVLEANIPDYKLVLDEYIKTLDQLHELNSRVYCVDQSLLFVEDFGADRELLEY